MPVLYYDKDKDDEKKKQEQQGTNQPQLGQTSQQVLGSKSGGDLGVGSSDSKHGTSSGAYTNLQSYIKAAEGQSLGRDVAGKVRSDLSTASSMVAPEDEKFRGIVDKSTKTFDPDYVKGALQNPTEVDQQKWETQYYNPKYGYTDKTTGEFVAGPTEYGYEGSDLEKAHKRGQDTAKLATSVSDRPTLLQEYYGRPGYGSGQQNLDTILMGQNPEAFTGIKEQAATDAKKLQEWRNYMKEYAGSGQARTDITGETTRDWLSGAQGQLKSDIVGRVSEASVARQQKIDNLKAALASGDITPEQAQIMGLSMAPGNFAGIGPGMHTWGIDPTSESYLTYGAAPTEHTITTPEEQAKMSGLMQLGGLENTYIPYSEQAGTYDPAKDIAFDYDKFSQAAETQQRGYGQGLQKSVDMGGGVRMPLQEALSSWRPAYENALEMVKYGGDQSGAAETIAQYEALLKQQEDLRTQHGYYDYLK